MAFNNDNTATNTGVGHKPTVGEKISGTVDSLVGKVTKNPAKVAEGEAKKHGDPVHGDAAGASQAAHNANTPGTGLTGNHNTHSTGTGLTGDHHTTGTGLTGNHNTHSTGTGLTGDHHTTGTGLTGSHGTHTGTGLTGDHTTGTGLTGNHHTTGTGLTGNHGTHSTGTGLTGNHGVAGHDNALGSTGTGLTGSHNTHGTGLTGNHGTQGTGLTGNHGTHTGTGLTGNNYDNTGSHTGRNAGYEHGQPTMGDKVSGAVDSMVGKATSNPSKVAEGEAKRTGDFQHAQAAAANTGTDSYGHHQTGPNAGAYNTNPTYDSTATGNRY